MTAFEAAPLIKPPALRGVSDSIRYKLNTLQPLKILLEKSKIRSGVSAGLAGASALRLGEPSAVCGQAMKDPESGAECVSVGGVS